MHLPWSSSPRKIVWCGRRVVIFLPVEALFGAGVCLRKSAFQLRRGDVKVVRNACWDTVKKTVRQIRKRVTTLA